MPFTTGVEDYDELLDSLLFGAWLVLAAMAGAYVILSSSLDSTKQATLMFYEFMVIAGIGCFVHLMDTQEPVEGRKAITWAMICLGGLLAIAFFSNIFTTAIGLVPKNKLTILPNYLQFSFLGSLDLGFSTLLGTLYFVSTGEECLKALGLVMFNFAEPIDDLFGITLPDGPEALAFQPLAWVIIVLWSIAHALLGQNPIWYAIPVFFDGVWIMYCQGKGNSWMTGILAHFANNTVFLGLGLLSILHIP